MIGDNGMVIVFNVVIGKNVNMFSVQYIVVVQCFSGCFFYKFFVGDIGVGLLVYVDEIGVFCQGDCYCWDCCVSQNVNVQWYSKMFMNFFGNDCYQC